MQDPDERSEPAHVPGPEHRMPGWVRALLIVGVLLLVFVAFGVALGRGEHGPSRHLPGGGQGQVEPNAGEGHGPPVQHP